MIIMKPIKTILIFGFFIGMIINSCDNEPNIDLNDSELTIEFSNGELLTENDIEFYDSSTNTYFLKSNLLSDTQITDFKIQVNSDSVLGGGLHLCVLSSMPPTPYFITDCFFSGRNILRIGYYGNGENLLNDSRIINSLEESNQFRHGLSCQIDSIKVIKSENQTDVICSITITNHDDISYYIPDLNQMGEQYYTDYTGGLSFYNLNTGMRSFIKDSNSNRFRDDINIDDLAILEANSKVTYTYKSRNYHEIPNGIYSVRSRFMGIVYTAADFDLNQDNGRIWVGEIEVSKAGIIIE